jgi:hypothetical protein
VTDKHRDAAATTVQDAIKEDKESLFAHRFTTAEGRAAHVPTEEPGFTDPEPSLSDMAWAGAAQSNDGPPIFRSTTHVTQPPSQLATDDSTYRLHYEDDEGYSVRVDAGEGQAECDINYAGAAKCTEMEQPSTVACCKTYFKGVGCAFCGHPAEAVCAQLPVHLFNETFDKKRVDGCNDGIAEDYALEQLHMYVEKVSSKDEGTRNACFKARAVCSGRECRIRAGMIDEETEAKYLSFDKDQDRHNFNRRHNCLESVLDSGVVLRKLQMHLCSNGASIEDIDRFMEAAVRDIAKFSYRMRIEQKHFITMGELLTSHHKEFGLSLTHQSAQEVTQTMARVPERIFVARLKEHLLSKKWDSRDLGNDAKNLGEKHSWYWHMKKNIIFGRFWPDALLVAHVEMKVRQWIVTGCQFDERGSPRFVLQKQSPTVDPITSFWDGAEEQSAILKPVFSQCDTLVTRLNKTNNGQDGNPFQAAKAVMPKNAPMWQHMQMVKAVDGDNTGGRENRPLFTPTRKTDATRGKEYAVRDNSFIKKDDLNMVECLNSASIGLMLAEVKHDELERSYPPAILATAQAAGMKVGEFFAKHHLQPLVLVKLADEKGYAMGPKPIIVGASASSYQVFNPARAQSKSGRASIFSNVKLGLVNRAFRRCWSGGSTKKRVDGITKKGMIPTTLKVSEMSPEYKALFAALDAHRFNAPGEAMNNVMRELVCIKLKNGELPTLEIDTSKVEGKEKIAVKAVANQLNNAHGNFNFFRDHRAAGHPNRFNIMSPITTDTLLYPYERCDEENCMNAVSGWLVDVRWILKAPEHRHPMLQPFCKSYTRQLIKAMAQLEKSLEQFLQPVRLSEAFKKGMLREGAIGHDEDPNRQRASKEHWDRNFERAAMDGSVDDSQEARDLYVTRDNGHSGRCAARPRAINRDPGHAPTHEQTQRQNWQNEVLYGMWAKIDKTFRSDVRNQRNAKGKQEVCDYYRSQSEELFFKTLPLLKNVVLNGENCDTDAQAWYGLYEEKVSRHSGGAGSQYFQMKEDAHNDTSRGGIKGFDAGFCQKASADAILKIGTEPEMRNALDIYFKRAAGLVKPGQAVQSQPTITSEEVQRHSDAQATNNDGDDDDGGGHSDDDDADDDVQGPGDPEEVGQRRLSRKKAKPATADQWHKKKKQEVALRHHEAHEQGYKNEGAFHQAMLDEAKKEQVHPTTLGPPSFAKCFRAYSSELWGGDAAPSPAKKARAKKAPAKKAAGKTTPRPRRRAVVESSDDEGSDTDVGEEAEECANDTSAESAASEDEDDATLAEQEAAEAGAQRHLFTPMD